MIAEIVMIVMFHYSIEDNLVMPLMLVLYSLSEADILSKPSCMGKYKLLFESDDMVRTVRI